PIKTPAFCDSNNSRRGAGIVRRPEMSIGSTGLSDWERPSEGKGGAMPRAPPPPRPPWEGALVVTPAVAARMLGISHSQIYKILPELESYLEGRARRITVKSIQNRIARGVAASTGKRPRGRPPGSKNKPKPAPLTTAATA